jgi:hypothetical protein
MMKWILAVTLALGVGYNYWKSHRPIRLEPPPVVRIASLTENRPPLQNNLFAGPVFRMNGYTITALAEFSVVARVILAEHYSSDRGAELAPVDLALAWGPMNDARVLNALQFSQSGRFYFWRYQGASPPIPRREIELNSANMHLIPGSDAIARRLKSVKRDDLVQFRGYLVQADATDGWRWISSLNREDTGAGACELVFVQELEVR